MGNFDFIIIGGGASGLLLADAMGRDPWFSGRRIVLFEKERQKGNDRTWCFWESGPGRFDELIASRWDTIRFRGPGLDQQVSILPLQYKMLQGASFYSAYYRKLEAYPNISVHREQVLSVEDTGDAVRVRTHSGTYFAGHAFSSVSFTDPPIPHKPYPVIQQHFIGWKVRTSQPVFDPDTPTFMDFGIPQRGNTRFMYVLPESRTEALVEYTLFSEDLLEQEEYETAIRQYLQEEFGGTGYEVIEEERGSIPMTCNDFTRADTPRITHIGIAGGWARPSTGYTFWNSSRLVPQLIEALKNGGKLRMAHRDRFWFYDLVLLEVLAADNARGAEVFAALFRSMPANRILRFLHQQTSLGEDLRIIAACPKRLFLLGLWRSLIKSLGIA
ncbi:lycopene cyclase family protein [Robiginitalea sp. SC105]|uniref:lycopene cyclase family protein n=1 Tax=Robiginitalea sp. SC105 TaxID=2762332 RepID=UPI001639546C|nr:lycopene cyclase family protein [Robiginitalea sp. SC105]MBC2838430.1 lycopene cyclase [Robiginitalea sp. SC105]